MSLRAFALSAVSLIIVFTTAISAQTVPTDNPQWRARCTSLVTSGGVPNPDASGIAPQRFEQLAEERSNSGQHFVACNLFLAAAAGQSAAGNAQQSQTDVSMAKIENKLGLHKKLGFVDKLNRTAEVLDEVSRQGAPPNQGEMAAMDAMIAGGGGTGATAGPAPMPVPAPGLGGEPTPAMQPAMAVAPAPAQEAEPLPAPAPMAAPPPPSAPVAAPAKVPAPAATDTGVSAADQGESRAAGVADWSKIDDHYICYYYGYTGGAHYVGGFLWPNLGLMPAGVGLTISGSNGYSSNVGSGTFRFTPMVPGHDTSEKLGTIIFTTGKLVGRRALLQTHKQFGHAIIFPAAWKQANGKSDAFDPADTWCYQKH